MLHRLFLLCILTWMCSLVSGIGVPFCPWWVHLYAFNAFTNSEVVKKNNQEQPLLIGLCMGWSIFIFFSHVVITTMGSESKCGEMWCHL